MDGKRIFKWVDENGVVHYGDYVPPDHSQRRQEEINRQGVTVKVTPAAKTKEQIAEEERQAKIQAEARRVREEQAQKDRLLLNTYANEQDLEKHYKEKIDGIDSVIRTIENDIALTNKTIKEKLDTAAEMERNGIPVPEQHQREINALRDRIPKQNASIVAKQKEKQELQGQAKRELTRLRELKTMQGKESISLPSEVVSEMQSTIVNCLNPQICIQAWARVKDYVQAQSNTRLKIATESQIITAEPTQPNNIGLSVISIVDPNGGARFQLDVLCHNSPEGQKYCSTPAVQTIRNGFKSYVESR